MQKTEKFCIYEKVFDKKVKKVAAGTFHSIALTSDDQVFATGDNTFGQLGLSSAKGIKICQN